MFCLTYCNIIAKQIQIFVTSFGNVNTNNTSSGLRKNVMLNNFGAKICGNIWCQCGHGRGGDTSDRTILIKVMCMCPLVRSGPCGTVMGVWKMGGITIDGELACPVAPHPKCGSCYLLRFLFRGGSLTLMNMASFMVQVMPWDSLST